MQIGPNKCETVIIFYHREHNQKPSKVGNILFNSVQFKCSLQDKQFQFIPRNILIVYKHMKNIKISSANSL